MTYGYPLLLAWACITFCLCLCLCVQVKGKCNAISIDKCQKTGVVFEQVIATCELVNCNSVQVSIY